MKPTNNVKGAKEIDYQVELIYLLAKIANSENIGVALEESIPKLYYFGRKYAANTKGIWVSTNIRGNTSKIFLEENEVIKNTCLWLINLFSEQATEAQSLAISELVLFLERIEL